MGGRGDEVIKRREFVTWNVVEIVNRIKPSRQILQKESRNGHQKEENCIDEAANEGTAFCSLPAGVSNSAANIVTYTTCGIAGQAGQDATHDTDSSPSLY